MFEIAFINFLAPIGERCHIESVCPDNAICETRSKCDGNLACYCKEGYVSNENNEKCLKSKTHFFFVKLFQPLTSPLDFLRNCLQDLVSRHM